MQTTCPITVFGANGDGKTFNTAALNQAIRHCAQAGGGTVLVPPGTYLTGPIQLLSRVTLHLEAGATIQASANLEDYPIEGPGASGESSRSGLITARDADTVSITARGVIEGNGLAFVTVSQPHQYVSKDYDKRYTRQGEDYGHPRFGTQHGPWTHGERPGNLLRFIGCRNVLLNGVAIQNSPTWTVQFNRCEGVNILGVHINSRGSNCCVPNDDGIDLVDCSRVHVADCDIETGDDCIAVFGSKKVTVSNCTLSARSAGVRIGYDSGETQDCLFNNLVIHNSNRGVNMNVRGAGSIENVLFSNLVIRTRLYTGHWWGKAEPINVSAVPLHPGGQLGDIRNVRFSNVLAEGEAGIVIHGCEQSRIQGLTLEGVRLWVKKSLLHESYGGNFDLRGAADLAHALFRHDIPGLYASYVDRLALRNLELDWAEDLPDFFTHGSWCEHCTGVHIRGFKGGPAHPGVGEAIRFD